MSKTTGTIIRLARRIRDGPNLRYVGFTYVIPTQTVIGKTRQGRKEELSLNGSNGLIITPLPRDGAGWMPPSDPLKTWQDATRLSQDPEVRKRTQDEIDTKASRTRRSTRRYKEE